MAYSCLLHMVSVNCTSEPSLMKIFKECGRYEMWRADSNIWLLCVTLAQGQANRWREKWNDVHTIHIPNFMYLALIVFKLTHDPDFYWADRLMDKQTANLYIVLSGARVNSCKNHFTTVSDHKCVTMPETLFKQHQVKTKKSKNNLVLVFSIIWKQFT